MKALQKKLILNSESEPVKLLEDGNDVVKGGCSRVYAGCGILDQL